MMLTVINIAADVLIAFSYLTIPWNLVRLLRDHKIGTRLGRATTWAFAAFVFTCGCTHILAVVTVWQPWYRLYIAAKSTTALISVVAAAMLMKRTPVLLSLPRFVEITLAELTDEQLNAELVKETNQKGGVA